MADGDKHGGPHPDTTLRIRDPETVSPEWDGSIKSFPVRAQAETTERVYELEGMEDTKKNMAL